MSRLFAVILFAFLPLSAVQAEEPTQAQVQRLFQLTGVDAQMDTMMRQLRPVMLNIMGPAMRNAAKQANLPLPDHFDQIVAEEFDIAFSDIRDELLREVVPLYQKSFSRADIVQLNDFYASDLGQRTVATAVEVQKVTGAMGQMIGQQRGRVMGAAIMERLKKEGGQQN